MWPSDGDQRDQGYHGFEVRGGCTQATGFLVKIDSIQNILHAIVYTNRLCGPPVMSLDGWQLLLED